MLNLALLLLALAAGIYLLIKANSLFLGKIFAALIWLQIFLSLAGIGVLAYKGVMHKLYPGCGTKKECRAEKQVIIRDGVESVHGMHSCSMQRCHKEGDSVVLDKATCEKMVGKQLCDSLSKERGRCIFSREECAKVCSATGAPCGDDKAGTACVKKCEGQEKKCCKK